MKRLILLLPILALALACTAQQRAETARASAVFACEVAVLAPHVPEALDAAELARDVVRGQVSLPLALARLGVAKAVADDVVNAFNTCFTGQPPLQPASELETKLVAPPPAYGRKVL
jgi:hypothetical protein